MKKWYQLTIVILLITMMGMANSFHGYMEKEQEFFHNIIKDQGLTIQELSKEKELNEEKYHETLIKIAENIKRNDSFLNIGGYEEDLPYDEEKDYFEKILSGSSDFDSLLNNTKNFFKVRNNYLSQLPDVWPVKYSPYNRITSPFGTRFNPFSGRLTKHNGIDIAGPWKAKIIATADGVVSSHWIFHREFGRMIIIEHANGFKTVYAHLSESYVHGGMEIEKGQVIGLMGRSGNSNGIHLHYEVRKDKVAVNPLNYMRSQIE